MKDNILEFTGEYYTRQKRSKELNEELSVMLFTGYTYKELKINNFPYYKELINKCDIVVEGPYDSTQKDNDRNWVGSKNQKFHYNSETYQKGIEFDNEYIDSMEFSILNNEILLSGYPFPIKEGN